MILLNIFNIILLYYKFITIFQLILQISLQINIYVMVGTETITLKYI